MGQALLAYISLDYAGIGQHPNLLTFKVNTWGRQERHQDHSALLTLRFY